jgi:hypothetical protein
MIYVRYRRQNLKPTPPPSPVPEPSQALIDVYDKYPNLDGTQPFKPKAFKGHLDHVFAEFGRHMVDENKTLSKDNIEKIGEKNLESINDGLKKVLMTHGPEWFLCSACCDFCLYCDREKLMSSCLPCHSPPPASGFALDR